MSFRPQSIRFKGSQRGIVLITSLLLLLVVTLLSVAMYRSFGGQERIAGATLEKQRSLQAAITALRYGEWWLSQGKASTVVACQGTVDGTVVGNMRACLNDLQSPTTLPWDGRTEYTPSTMNVDPEPGLNETTGDVNYASKPSLHVAYIGFRHSDRSSIYRVTGAAHGGSDTTASVVQSTYGLKSRSVDLGGL